MRHLHVHLLAALPAMLAMAATVPGSATAVVATGDVCDEKDPTTGKALIFMGPNGELGPIDFSTGLYADIANPNHIGDIGYRAQSQVCLTELGHYNPETGFYEASNSGYLTGKYLETDILTINWPSEGLHPFEVVHQPGNDFRITFDWNQSREDNAYLSQAHAYHYITDFRKNVFNADLINRLNIDEEKRKNVLTRQFKAELPEPAVQEKPLILANENIGFGAQGIFFQQNKIQLEFLHRLFASNGKNAFSALYDPHIVAGEYAELVGHWLIDTPGYYPPESSFSGNGWKTNVLPALTDGLATWAAYRYTGETELFRYFLHSARSLLPSVTCGPDNGFLMSPRCDQGFESRNVMTFSESAGPSMGHFPYQHVIYSGGTHAAGADLGGLFFANLYHDLVDQVGLAEQDIDALVLQTHAEIDRTDKFPMRYFGQLMLRAAAKLWPAPGSDPERPAESIYHDQIRHTLLMRGIPVDARIPCSFMDSDDCCNDTNEPDCVPIGSAETAPPGEAGMFPPSYGAHGTFEQNIPLMIESRLPETQPTHVDGVYIYNYNLIWVDGYLEPGDDFDYMAYRFLKGSEYGPYDYLVITNDPDLDLLQSHMDQVCDAYEPHDNFGYPTFCHVFEGRELSNLTLLVPGPHLRWKRNRGRGPNEYEANYMIDTAPAGFRVIDGIKDGFAFHAVGSEPVDGRRSIELTVADPSQTFAGDAVYDWQVTTYELIRTPVEMDQVSSETLHFDDAACITLHDLNVDQPIRITLTRTRDGESRSITLDETVRSIDRIHDGDVHGDFNLVLNFTGMSTPEPGDCAGGKQPGIPGDLNGDGSIGVPDLLILLANWGPCAEPANCPADLDGNGNVGVPDLLLLLASWG